MSEVIRLMVNHKPLTVSPGATVAVAIMQAGELCRTSVRGEPRGPLCGMGTCLECRVTIDGRQHCRSCQILCRDGMDVETDA